LTLKRAVGQVNTVIHAVGMLSILPRILEPDEQLLSLSIGAGNTGKNVDLETDRRVAEFKFIDWKGADSLRQDAVFTDLVKLCLLQTDKQKYLYLSGSTLALKFFRGRRAISSVLARRRHMLRLFTEAYGTEHTVVSDFFTCAQNTVHIVDLHAEFPELFGIT
jgi:hypothetical protein